jgi:8-oxo-dGTP diphosphatase
MQSVDEARFEQAFDWCAAVLGPCHPASDHTREHPGQRSSVTRLRTLAGCCYLKMHRDPAHWQNEVHAYERWAPAFGVHAPRLMAVRDAEPLALIISELPGTMMEEIALQPDQARAAWRDAGRALAGLHALEVGRSFGPCRRDGSPVGEPMGDAETYLAAEFAGWLERGRRGDWLTAQELAVVRRAEALLPAFAGERPRPCHRDYCPPNWLATGDGRWGGVIDFEFAYWDVRANDFARLPGWEWVQRPELVEALLEGYSEFSDFPLSPEGRQQRLVAEVLYALVAEVWGEENDYRGFAAEGREALNHLAAHDAWTAHRDSP